MQKAVPLEVNEKVYYLRYDINSIIQAEEEAGIVISGEVQKGMGPVRAMLYAGLLWQNKQMTLIKAGEILQELAVEDKLAYAIKQIEKANEVAFGKKMQAPDPKPNQEKIQKNQYKKKKKK